MIEVMTFPSNVIIDLPLQLDCILHSFRKQKKSMTSSSSPLHAMGVNSMWGYSPSFDLQNYLTDEILSKEDQCNILLLGPGDIRHILHTIAHRNRSTWRPIHFYVHEESIEVLARHLLLLQIIFDVKLPFRQRCNTFLEVFGNSLVQERTAQYVEEKGKELIDLVCNGQNGMSEFIDLSQLKQKERDELVDCFNGWKVHVPFDVKGLRDQRLRNYYALRYDYRSNVIDWDYTMNLKKIEGTSIIHTKQFQLWRNTGVAFEFGDQTYTVPNRSMSSFAMCNEKGKGTTMRRGFWTDICTGPYISLGLDGYKSNKFAEELFDILNKGSGCEQHRHNTVEVCVYNILSFIYEMETGEVYKMKRAHEIYSGIGEDEEEEKKITEIPQEDDDETNANAKDAVDQQHNLKKQESDCPDDSPKMHKAFDGVKIFFVTGDKNKLLMKKKFINFFHRAFISFQAAHIISNDMNLRSLNDILAEESTVTVETPIYLVPLTIEQKLLGIEKIKEYASQRSWKPKVDRCPQKDSLDASFALLDFEYKQ